MNWTTEQQTGWRRPGPQYLCRDPAVLARISALTYDAHAPGWAEWCVRRLGMDPRVGVQTPAVRAAFQDAWDVWTPMRDCIEVWTPSWPQVHRYMHGVRLPDGSFLGMLAGETRLTDYRTGVQVARLDDPRLADYPTLNE